MKVFFVLLFSLCILCSCGVKEEASDEKQRTINVKNSTIQEVDKKTGQEISKHLADLASGIPSVNDATAVVLGRYAIVGIDVDKNLDRSEVGSIKYTVAESLKNDPNGARAVVIADPDINARLKEIAEDIQKGEPIQGIMNELADISGRLMPEVPADLTDPNPKNTLNKPKKQLNESEEKNLNQKQEEQSNYHK
ncbi:YhcN/YlaJ family sporulation lipoprotein [Niallia oryzisoli]|uniref:YhcN/YlaJ family sporulation lipoprotein n=1 Tax=Niallia oryzisoli TaxID=1737571 RepID=UPI0037369254